ncbi:TPA: DUF4340 domain-containing protein [Candidatus Poribacteria bacterium]|nr:DUF4340 domain-containing protein [Candidatus Poribacteria bacterium]
MKIKQIVILLGVFVVLFIIWLIFGRESLDQSEPAVSLFPDFKSDSVAKVELTKDDKTTVLNRDNGKWLVETSENYPADKKFVEDVLSKVSEFKTDNLISDKPEKQSIFEVDSSGIEAKFSDSSGNLIAHFFVGKMGTDYRSGYVRKADSNEVYIMDGNLRSMFGKESGEWRDKTIFNFSSGNVTKLTIVSEEGKIILQLDTENNKWKLIEPEAANAKKDVVERILNTLSALKANNFAEKKELKEYGLDEPKSLVSADLNDGTSKTLFIGKEESGKYYVKRADQETVFLVSKYTIDNQLLRKVDALKEEETKDKKAADEEETK